MCQFIRALLSSINTFVGNDDDVYNDDSFDNNALLSSATIDLDNDYEVYDVNGSTMMIQFNDKNRIIF